MRLLLACLLVVAVGCGDDDSPGQGDGGAAASGGAGSSGKSGSHSGAGGSAGKGASGTSAGAGRSGSGGVGGKAGATLGMIKLVPNIVAGTQTSSGGSGVGSQQNALRVGSPSATTLLSLKYYIISIQLCEDLEVMGSGSNTPKGCISLYQNMPAGSPDYNTYTVMEAEADQTPGR